MVNYLLPYYLPSSTTARTVANGNPLQGFTHKFLNETMEWRDETDSWYWRTRWQSYTTGDTFALTIQGGTQWAMWTTYVCFIAPAMKAEGTFLEWPYTPQAVMYVPAQATLRKPDGWPAVSCELFRPVVVHNVFGLTWREPIQNARIAEFVRA